MYHVITFFENMLFVRPWFQKVANKDVVMSSVRDEKSVAPPLGEINQ